MKYFVGGVATTASLWGLLYLYESPPPGQYDLIDKLLVGEIMLTFAFGAFVMYKSRSTWTFRGVGVFLSSIGVAVLFALSSWIAYKGVRVDDSGHATSRVDPGFRQAMTDLDRSLLFVGGFMLFTGLVDYSLRKWFGKPIEDSPIAKEWADGDGNRRGDSPGRRSTDGVTQ